MKQLLLPDPEYFQSNDKKLPPLIKFYDWVMRTACPAVAVLSNDTVDGISSLMQHVDISKVIIHEYYDEKLRKVTKQFLMRTYKCYAKQAEKEIAWHFLDIGPSTREIENKSKHHVYVDDGFLKGHKYEQR